MGFSAYDMLGSRWRLESDRFFPRKEREMRKIYLLPCACAVIAGVATASDLEAGGACPTDSEVARLEIQEVTRDGEPVDSTRYEQFDVQISSSHSAVVFEALHEGENAYVQAYRQADGEASGE
jgi:hypothetical protein